LTGRLPFEGPVAAVLGQIMVAEPKPPSKRRPNLDRALESTCLRAMAKQPGDRFTTMGEFASALGRYLKGKGEPIEADGNPGATGADASVRNGARPARWRWVAVAAVLVALLGTLAFVGRGLFGTRAEPETASLRPDEPVETLTVTLHVGPGEDLQERVALDLGLGFPLWLEPVGSRSPGKLPFGAVPQQTTSADRWPAESSVTFTFSARGEPGQDVLRTSQYLLAGVRVSDITRVGFTGLGSANWELAGYEIKINDKPFLDNQAVHRKVKDVQQQAKARLAELGLKSGPLEAERADLRDRAETKRAPTADTKRLEEVEIALAGLAPERTRLERQLKGQYPWHVDPVPRETAESDRATARSSSRTPLMASITPFPRLP